MTGVKDEKGTPRWWWARKCLAGVEGLIATAAAVTAAASVAALVSAWRYYGDPVHGAFGIVLSSWFSVFGFGHHANAVILYINITI